MTDRELEEQIKKQYEVYKWKKRINYVKKIAREFERNGWSVKEINKAFTDATYETQEGYNAFKKVVASERRKFKSMGNITSTNLNNTVTNQPKKSKSVSKTIKYRENYIRKVQNEFIKNGWDTTKLNKKFYKNTLTTEKGFNKYKELVKTERSYFKEREKIKKDILEYDKKVKNGQGNRLKQTLAELYGKGTKEIKRAWSDRKLLGLKWNDKAEDIKQKVIEKFENDFTNQLSYFDKKGKIKHVGGLFKYHSLDRGVYNNLNEITKLMQEDDKAITNASLIIDYVYEKLIPLYYEGTTDEPPIYGKDKKAPDKFFTEVSKKMLDYYKNELL